MLVRILIGLAAIVVVFAAVVAMQPSEFRVARSGTIAAPAPTVFAQVNDFHKWPAWSPYDKLDPAMKKTYDGPPAGTGASYAWAGNSHAGVGRATITESRPNEFVRIKLDFEQPFAGTAFAEFRFRPEGERTRRGVEPERHEQLRSEGGPPLHEHGQDGRRPVRGRAGAAQVGGREGAAGIAPFNVRIDKEKLRCSFSPTCSSTAAARRRSSSIRRSSARRSRC